MNMRNKWLLFQITLFLAGAFFNFSGHKLSSKNYKAPASTTSSVGQASCSKVMQKLIEEDGMVLELKKYTPFNNLSPKFQRLYRESIDEAKINESELASIFENIESLPEDETSIELFQDYLLFVRTYLKANQQSGFQKTFLIFSEEGLGSMSLFSFRRARKSYANYEKRKVREYLQELKQDQRVLTENELNIEALRRANIDRNHFRKIYNGCHTKGITEEHQYGGKAFTYFTVGISALSSGSFYTLSSYLYDDDFGSKEFFGKLTYETVGAIVWAVAASIIFKDPEGSFFSKTAKMYASDNTLVATDAIAWDLIFGDDQVEAEAKLREIVESPTYREDVEKLIEVIQQKSFIESIRQNFFTILEKIEESENPEHEIDWESFNEKMLKDPKVKEELVRGILKEQYDDENGEYIQTGSYAADRYLYYSILGVPFTLIDTAVSLKIYQALCIGRENPALAIGKAALIFTTYSALYDAINYPLRKTMINQ